jgi:hypothetical protein
VVTATCVGSGDDVLEDRRFRLCVIDEATQVCPNNKCVLASHSCLNFVEILSRSAVLLQLSLSFDLE